jgi:hypothetical protein
MYDKHENCHVSADFCVAKLMPGKCAAIEPHMHDINVSLQMCTKLIGLQQYYSRMWSKYPKIGLLRTQKLSCADTYLLFIICDCQFRYTHIQKREKGGRKEFITVSINFSFYISFVLPHIRYASVNKHKTESFTSINFNNCNWKCPPRDRERATQIGTKFSAHNNQIMNEDVHS